MLLTVESPELVVVQPQFKSELLQAFDVVGALLVQPVHDGSVDR